MEARQNGIPEETIEAIARSFYKETAKYGFKQIDYVRFVNRLFDLSMKNNHNGDDPALVEPVVLPGAVIELPIRGERVRIKPFKINSDFPLVNQWLDDEYGRYFLLSRVTSMPVSMEVLATNPQNIFGLITLSDGSPIGLLGFLDYDPLQKKAELRKLIGESLYRGQGFAKEATSLWINYGIHGLGIKKIYLSTLDTAFRNIRLNEELGFKVEGILRNECFFDSEYHDILRMSMIIKE